MLNNLKSKLIKSIKSKKLNVFIFFLILSFLFLVISKLSKTYTETIAFQVVYENVPEQHSIVQGYDSILKVKVRAYGFNLLAQNFYKHKISIDFKKDVQLNDNTYTWDSKNAASKIDSKLGSKVTVLSMFPETLVFPYEVMAVKTVPVKLDSEIIYAPGYDLVDSLSIRPDSIKVIGPQKMINKISSIKTAKLALKNVKLSINKEVDLELKPSMEHLKLGRTKVKVVGTVEKFTEGTFEVPVEIINLPSDVKINYFPKTVMVSYYVSLERYKKIKALDFKIVCDYEAVKNQDRTFFIPHLVAKPEFVKSAKVKQNKIEFIIIE